MTPSTLPEHFAQIRALMQHASLDQEQRTSLWHCAQQTSHKYPTEFAEQILPYMQGFPHHFKVALTTLLNLNHIRKALQTIPFARFGLDRAKTSTNSKKLAKLLASDLFKYVSFLSLYNNPLGDEGISLLAQSHETAHLQGLDLSYTKISQKGYEALSNSSQLLQLHTLNLSGNDLNEHAAHSLLNATHFQSVKHTEINGRPLLDATLSSLAQSPLFLDLKSLALRRTHLTDATLSNVLNHAGHPNLESLDLSYNTLTAKGLEHLCHAHLPSLKSLNLSQNTLGTGGLKDLLGTNLHRTLEHLNLNSCRLDSFDIQALAQHDASTRIRTLCIAHTPLSADALSSLLHPESGLQSLKHLDIESAQLTEHTLLAISKHPSHGSLKTVKLRGNSISPSEISTLNQCAVFHNIQELGISGRTVGDHGIKLLTQGPLTHLRHLNLYNCGLTKEGAKIIANAPNLKNLEHLWLHGNIIEDDGLLHLLRSPYLTSLKSLNVNDTGLTHKSFKALANHEPLSRFEHLFIQIGTLTTDERKQFFSSPYLNPYLKRSLKLQL